jgi:lipoate---protein ligase
VALLVNDRTQQSKKTDTAQPMVPNTEPWRLLPCDGGSSERHMRLSDALARLVKVPTLWWHWTDGAAIILGAGQSGVEVDVRACAAAGVQIAKRSSGGTTVYADPALVGLDVALPPGHRLNGTDVVESYRWLGEVWVNTLRRFDVPAHLVSVEEARARSRTTETLESILRMACFGSISPYEVLVRGRKLVGLSQVRRGGRVLFQSGIYLRFDAEVLTNLLQIPNRHSAASDLAEVAAGLDSVTNWDVGRSDIIRAFSDVVRERLGVVQGGGSWTSEELAHVHRSESEV